MKLWILRPRGKTELQSDNPWNPWYDKTFGFVVRAETERDARQLCQQAAEHELYGACQPWLDEAYSTCQELLADGDAEIIISDFASA